MPLPEIRSSVPFFLGLNSFVCIHLIFTTRKIHFYIYVSTILSPSDVTVEFLFSYLCEFTYTGKTNVLPVAAICMYSIVKKKKLI